MTLQRSTVVVALALSCGLASGSGTASRTLLRVRRAEDDASQMNAYAASVMEVLQTASRELEDALATPPPPAAATKAKRDQCGDWCAARPGGTDSHCVTDCQAEMYQCNDHNKTRTDEKVGHDDCVATVQAKFTAASAQNPDTTDAHFLAKKAKGPVSKFSNATAMKFRAQQDVLSKLFQHLKENVAKFNKRDKDGKAEADKAMNEIEQHLEKERELLKNPKLSAFNRELITNRTRSDESALAFRRQDHVYEHNVFHANLKATHGLMSRVSGVLDAYKQVLLTGHLDPNIKTAMINSLSSQPKALVETRSQLRKQRRLRLWGGKRL